MSTDDAVLAQVTEITCEIKAAKESLDKLDKKVRTIDSNTTPSPVADFAGDYAKNLFWEFFGFHKTDKSAVGLGVSALGIFLSLARTVYFFRKRNAAPPSWLRGMMVGYWCLLIVTLTAVTFVGFFGNHASPKTGLAVADVSRLESRLDTLAGEVRRLRGVVAVTPDGSLRTRGAAEVLAAVREDTTYLRGKWTGWFLGLINMVLIVACGFVVFARTERIN